MPHLTNFSFQFCYEIFTEDALSTSSTLLCKKVKNGQKLKSREVCFVCEKDDREESSMKSLGGMTWPKDEMGSQIVSSESDISHLILVFLSRNSNSQAQARCFPALAAPQPEFPVIFGSKWDPLTSGWRQGGASPERLAELPTGVSPLQKRIWKWDFYHCSSCNFFFHICFCHSWCELRNSPLKDPPWGYFSHLWS